MTYSPSSFSFEIPEFSPSLVPWGGFGPLIARMIQVHDQLASSILLAPPKWLHIVSIYLWKNQGADIYEMACEIYEKHPRELFNECWSDAAPTLYSILKRCGRKALLLEQYEQLNATLGSNIADIVLQTKALSAVRIEFFFKVREMDPLVAPACRLLSFSYRAAKNFNVILQHMRRLNLIGTYDAESKVLRNGAYKSVIDYVETRLARVKAPERLTLTPLLRQIICGDELSSIAIQWQNCLRAPAYRIALGLGTKIFIMLEGDEADENVALASFERTAFGWHMDECEMPSKRRVTGEMRQRIVNLMAEDGIAANSTTFAIALGKLESCHEPLSWDIALNEQDKDVD